MSARDDTVWIAERAKALGFDLCGVVGAAKFPELAKMEHWLTNGYAGEMKYLFDPRRSDPERAMAGIRSIIVCVLNYNTEHRKSTEVNDWDADEPRGWISRYAWGDDYHHVVRRKLEALSLELRNRFEKPFEALVYADTGPLHERVFAKYAGLGWIGKNTLLLNQQIGSWFFLGTILTTLDLGSSLGPAELPPADLCGSCRRCIDACPTSALIEPYVMDARRCISYLTIELRGSIPEELREPMGHHVFGCDICQDVCPWNRRAPVTQQSGFQPRNLPSPRQTCLCQEQDELTAGAQETSLFLPKLESLAAMDEEEYRQAFRGSPVKRAKWRGLVRNACIALGNSRCDRGAPAYQRVCVLLKRLAASCDPFVAESALWALSRIQ
jgi:epoxyqueuosine reductase